MLLELPISEVLLEGKGEESTEGKREAEWWEKHICSNRKEFSTNFIQMGEKEYNVGEMEVEGGGWYQSYLLKGKGHGITQGRQGMC